MIIFSATNLILPDKKDMDSANGLLDGGKISYLESYKTNFQF
jgi:hypothetical protein